MDWRSTGATRWNSFSSRCGNVAVQRSLAHMSGKRLHEAAERRQSLSEAFQTYINMVTGVTKTTQAKASATARAMLKQAGLEDVATETSERVTKLAEEIMSASRANRELLQHYVNTEVDKAAARLGFARVDEVEALRDEVARLRAQVEEATAQVEEATARMAEAASVKKAATKRAPAKKTSATMTPTKKTAAARSAGRKPPRKTAASASDSSQSGEK
jgi:polyhydroxyalkanoate synthesis regulator phasin